MIEDIEIIVAFTIKRNQLEALHWVDRYTDRKVCDSLFFLFQSEYDTIGKRGYKYDTKW
ncbi:MAG: hypothetical protein JTJ30_12675 [Catenibacterium mitsuokai]|nr:hypothetical protein [Catenibacterium mitsuokai]MBN2932820.1 hypothetical protein [Catenibacterium mitsuokai]